MNFLINILILLGIYRATQWAWNYFFAEKIPPGGFHDWVKNPDYRQEMEDFFEERRNLTVPDNITGPEIKQLVESLYVEDEIGLNLRRLELLGNKALPYLLAALEDDRTWDTFTDDILNSDEQPFSLLCDLLQPLHSLEAVEAFIKFSEHPNESFREKALYQLGNIGAVECTDVVVQGLRDEDKLVSGFTAMGITCGIEEGEPAPRFLESIQKVLIELVSRTDISHDDYILKLLMQIAPHKAKELFLSNEQFQLENNNLIAIIECLNQAKHKIPHSQLLPLLEQLKPRSGEYPYSYQYAYGLLAYGINPNQKTETTLRSNLNHSEKRVAESAAEALVLIYGIDDPYQAIREVVEKKGEHHLTEPQRLYDAVMMYDYEVCNGGHLQYFANSSGGNFKLALRGFEAIGDAARASILSKAGALFGQQGPATDRDERFLQLQKFSTGQEKKLNRLDSQYYDCDENVEVLALLYVIKHKEHFVSTT